MAKYKIYLASFDTIFSLPSTLYFKLLGTTQSISYLDILALLRRNPADALAKRSRMICKPTIYKIYQLKTEKSIFHPFLKGIEPFSFGVSWDQGAGSRPEDSKYSKYPSGEILSCAPGAFVMCTRCPGTISIIFISPSFPKQFWD